jgi:hypothetical protein
MTGCDLLDCSENWTVRVSKLGLEETVSIPELDPMGCCDDGLSFYRQGQSFQNMALTWGHMQVLSFKKSDNLHFL